MAKDGSYFVKIQNPKQSRRSILESTRDTLKVLQDYEDFKRTRQRKTEMINQFRADTKNVRSLIADFKRLLPKTPVKERAPIMQQTMQRPVVELRRIEQELAEVEAKLNQLS